MNKVKFNEETLKELREYVKTHTVKEASNKFGTSIPTLSRIMRENGIKPSNLNTQPNIYDKIDDDVLNKIKWMYENTSANEKQIAKEFGIGRNGLRRILADHYTQEYKDTRHKRLLSEQKMVYNPQRGLTFNDEFKYDGNNYVVMKKPDWYTGRSGKDTVFVHTVVMCEALGITEIPKGFCVHHIDFNRRNNDLSNLCLMSLGAHMKLHQMLRKI